MLQNWYKECQKIRPLSARDLVCLLKNLGIVFIRQTGGSHAVFRDTTTNKQTVIALDPRREYDNNYVKSILRPLGVLDRIDDLRKYVC